MSALVANIFRFARIYSFPKLFSFSKKVIKYTKFIIGWRNIVLQKDVESLLAKYQDPYLERDLLTAKAIKRIAIAQDHIQIDIVLGYPHLGIQNELISQLKQQLAPVALD